MKKIYVVIGIVILFLGASVLQTTIAVKIQKTSSYISNQDILYVDDDGNDYPDPDSNTIQGAIDIASTGDEIRVYKGNYPENVVVDRKLSIIGGWNGTSTIDGGGSGNVVKIIATAPNVRIENFTITNSGNNVNGKKYEAGIHILSGLNIIFGNNISYNLGDGIYISNSAGNQISENEISNNGFDGIGLFSVASGANSISGNKIYDNGNDGIQMFQGHSNFIRENTISGNKNGIHFRRSRFNLIEKNYIGNSDENGIFFELLCIANSIIRNNITGNTGYGIFLKFQCDANTFLMNNFIDNDGTKSILYTPNIRFLSCFLNGWRENYWDDYKPIIPNWWYLMWGRWGFIPWPNFDLYPVSNPYSWPPT